MQKRGSLKKTSKIESKPKPIKSEVAKIKTENPNTGFRRRFYRILRDAYFELHPFCEICHLKKGTSLHHRARRKGYNMFRFFMNLCRECHDWVHDNPAEASRLGYLIDARCNEEDWFKSIIDREFAPRENPDLIDFEWDDTEESITIELYD